MYEKRCRENKEGQEKGNQITKMPEMKQTNKKSLEQIDLDLEAKME